MWCSGLMNRQGNNYGGSLPNFAINFHFAFVFLDDIVCAHQAHAYADTIALGGEIKIEQGVQFFGWDTLSGIGYLDPKIAFQG